jgi:hypothetical protein
VENSIRQFTEAANSTKKSHTRFSSARATGNIHITNTGDQENESPAAPQNLKDDRK